MIWLIPSLFDIQPFFRSIILWEKDCRIFLPILSKQHVNRILSTIFQYFNICFIFTILKHFNSNRITPLYPLFSRSKSQTEFSYVSLLFWRFWSKCVYACKHTCLIFTYPTQYSLNNQPKLRKCRSSRLEVFCKKVALKYFAKYRGQQP